MNNNNNSDNDLLAAGQALQQRREKLGLDVKECADSLKITVNKLAAIESGDKSKFNSELFLKGYLKNYAKLVNVSEEEVMHLYNAQHHTDTVVDIEPEGPEKPASRWWLPYVMGGVIVIGWFVVSDHLESSKNNYDDVVATEKKTLEITEVVPVSEGDSPSEAPVAAPLDVVAPVEAQADSASSLSPSVADEVIETAATNSSEPQPGVSESAPALPALEVSTESSVDEVTQTNSISPDVNDIPAAELVAQASSQGVDQSIDSSDQALEVHEQDTLSLTFTEECWVNVVDADGEVIISRLYSPGDSVQVKGKAPFEIILGNVNGASITLNGQPATLNPNGLNRILRLTLGD